MQSITAKRKHHTDSVAAIALARRKGWLYSQDRNHRQANNLRLPYGTRNVLHAIIDSDYSTINRESSHFSRLMRLGLISDKESRLTINWGRINSGGQQQ